MLPQPKLNELMNPRPHVAAAAEGEEADESNAAPLPLLWWEGCDRNCAVALMSLEKLKRRRCWLSASLKKPQRDR
jgi:hypothetical protein